MIASSGDTRSGIMETEIDDNIRPRHYRLEFVTDIDLARDLDLWKSAGACDQRAPHLPLGPANDYLGHSSFRMPQASSVR